MKSTRSKPPLNLRIRAARERAGMTQGQLAEAIEYTRPEVNRLERGVRFSPRLAYLAARLLKVRVSADDLFGEARE